jgi:hypothetical protein
MGRRLDVESARLMRENRHIQVTPELAAET